MTAPTDPIAVTLEAQQWNVVFGALAEAPWRIADPVIRAIAQQTQATQQAEPEIIAPAKPNGSGELHSPLAA